MSQDPRHGIVRFPSLRRSRETDEPIGALPDVTRDAELRQALDTWRVPPSSDESRERLLGSARMILAERSRLLEQERLRLALPDRHPRPWRLVAGFATIVTILSVWGWFGTATVSAREALWRAETAEALRWRTTPDSILYQHIELRTAVGGARQEVRWEVWSTPDGVRRVTATQPREQKLVARYLDMLARNGLDNGPPLSATAFSRWRERLSAAAGVADWVERVEIANSGSALKVHVRTGGTPASGYIVDATVLFQTGGLPIAQALDVRTSSGAIERFEVSETRTTIVSRASLPAGMFDEEPRLAAPRAAATTAAVVPTTTELEESEIGALFALHRLQADLGEQVGVIRRPNYVEVHGVVDGADRLNAIASAVRGLPHVRVSLVRGDEAASTGATKRSRGAARPRESPGARVLVEPTAFEPPLLKFVEAHLEQQRQESAAGLSRPDASEVNGFVRQIVAHGTAAVAEAWALRRLSERYSPDRRAALPGRARGRLDDMTVDHLRSLRQHLAFLRRALQPIAVMAASDGRPALPRDDHASGADPRSTMQVFREVTEVERQLASLLLSQSADGAELDGAELVGAGDPAVMARLQDVLSALARLDRALTSPSRGRWRLSDRRGFAGLASASHETGRKHEERVSNRCDPAGHVPDRGRRSGAGPALGSRGGAGGRASCRQQPPSRRRVPFQTTARSRRSSAPRGDCSSRQP